MSIAARKALNAYNQNSLNAAVEAASPHRLIIMLYEGAIKAVNLAKLHMQSGAVAGKGAAVSKAIAIIEEGLRLSLDKEKGGELAENLDALYDFMARELLEGNLRNDEAKLDTVLRLLTDLKEAWESIDPAKQVAAQPAPGNVQRDEQPLSYGRV
ncbi:flagellar protein FliS [Formivibrio citricus]|uniref:Flagellar secretion chaperone FliS n=1 Tax=Formivibrio citricus TaxID=83765 RepID=A0A1I4VBQ4_9NEIS|nr:flagellar export chaperone FliS [Formivibrio citricus]SFM98605.1 flagellar protein FliS [Formivibrio citricus]